MTGIRKHYILPVRCSSYPATWTQIKYTMLIAALFELLLAVTVRNECEGTWIKVNTAAV